MKEENIKKYNTFVPDEIREALMALYSSELSSAITNYILSNDDIGIMYSELENTFCDLNEDKDKFKNTIKLLTRAGIIKRCGNLDDILENTSKYYPTTLCKLIMRSVLDNLLSNIFNPEKTK